jgi:hypothetical protein
MFLFTTVFISIPLAYNLTTLDPLEQFDVLALPILGGGLTNLSLLLALNILIMSA